MKTKLFYLVAIFAIAMVSFNSCSKDEAGTPDEPTVKPIISETELAGKWNFKSVEIDSKIYTTSQQLTIAGYSANDKFNLEFKFKYEYTNNVHYHYSYFYCENVNYNSQGIFTLNTTENKIIETPGGYTFQIQSYKSNELTFKVISVKSPFTFLINSIYTFKKA